VVAAEHDGERAAGVDVADGLADLVEGLLDVARDGEDVAEIRRMPWGPNLVPGR